LDKFHQVGRRGCGRHGLWPSLSNPLSKHSICHVGLLSIFHTFLIYLDTVADLPGRRAFRSSGTSRLVAPSVRLSTVDNRAFPVVGPRIWNDLPADVTSAESLSTFRQWLKTNLFTISFPGYFLDV